MNDEGVRVESGEMKRGSEYVVQEFSSRFETPRMRLSDELWEYTGVAPFSTENVPFSGRTGKVFADKIVTLLTKRLADVNETKGIHLYEFGGGSGLLSKHVLDLLQEHNPDIYARVKIHLSDISPKSIQRLQSSGLYSGHEGHVDYNIIDASEPLFPEQPFMVFHTYLADSLPTRHLEVHDGQAWEIQIQTSIRQGARVIDTSGAAPVVLTEKDLVNILNGSSVERRLALGPRILETLEETTRKVPIEEIKNMSAEEAARIQEITAKLENGRFNYSFLVDKSTQEIFMNLTDGGLFLISDYGRTQFGFPPIENLTSNFGVTAACSVDFAYLMNIGKQLKANTLLTDHRQGFPQEILFDTRDDEQIANQFGEAFNNFGGEYVDRFLGHVDSVLDQQIDREDQISQVKQLFDNLPQNYKEDLQLLSNLSNMLVDHSFFEDAINFTSMVIEDAGHVSGPTYRIRARAYAALGKIEEAEADLKSAIAISSVDSRAYSYLASLYLSQQKFYQALAAKEQYLKCTRQADIVHTMVEIAGLQDVVGQREKAGQTRQQVQYIVDRLGLSSLSTKDRQAYETIQI